MQRKLLGITSVGFEATVQLLIIYFACVIYFRKIGNILQKCVRYLYTSRDGNHMNLVRLMKVCLNYTYSRFPLGKNLSGFFPINNILKKMRCFVAIALQLFFILCH